MNEHQLYKYKTINHLNNSFMLVDISTMNKNYFLNSKKKYFIHRWSLPVKKSDKRGRKASM